MVDLISRFYSLTRMGQIFNEYGGGGRRILEGSRTEGTGHQIYVLGPTASRSISSVASGSLPEEFSSPGATLELQRTVTNSLARPDLKFSQS